MTLLDSKAGAIHAAALGTALCMLPATARAQNALDLSWDAPSECPRREDVLEHVRRLAGKALENAEKLRAKGSISGGDGRYQLTLTVNDRGEQRERTMVSHSCIDLAGAAAVALGLLLREGPTESAEPGGSSSRSAASPADRNATAKQDDTTRPPPPAGSARATRADSNRETDTKGEAGPDATESGSLQYGSDSSIPGSLNADLILRAPIAAVDLGPLPNPSIALGGAFGVESGGFRVTFGARVFTDQKWLIAGSEDLGADVSRWQVELWLCKGWRVGSFELSPCLTGGLDHFSATGTGPGVAPSEQNSLSLVLGLASTAHFQVFESMAFFASLAFGVETTRPALNVEGLGTIGQVAPAQLSLALGPEWIF